MALTTCLLYIIITLVSLLLYLMHRNLTYWQRRGIPYDVPHPIAGNLQEYLRTKSFHDIFAEIYKKYKGTGPFCGVYMMQRPVVMALDTAFIKNVLVKDFSNFANRGVFYNTRDDPLTGHLFALDGVKWRQLRQKLSPTFTSGKMKFMFPTVVGVAEKFVKVFNDRVQKNADVEIKDLVTRFTTDLIGTCAFGIECNSLMDQNAEFFLKGRMFFDKLRHGDVINGFILSFPKLARWLRMRHIHDEVHNFFMRIVRETVEHREQNNIKRRDFMDLLIELKNQKGINADGLNGLTIEEVAAQAFIFFLAGFETSSSTMGFALYELACHPELQEALRQEIKDVLAKHEQQFTYECMSEMELMNQVISETLRLYSILPFLQRQAINEYVVPGHPKYVIEKNTVVLIPVDCIHHDPELYPEPHKFMPERFSPELVQQRDSIHWLAFGEGPRNCIGLRFGQMEARVGLTYLIKNFRFSVGKHTQVPMVFDEKSQFLLSAKGGITLKVEKIK